MSITLDVNPESVLTISTGEASSCVVRRGADSVGGSKNNNVAGFRPVSLASSSTLEIGPFSTTRRHIIDQMVGDVEYSIEPVRLNYNNLSTGIYEGGGLEINGSDPTKFDLAAGKGAILDNYTDPENPVVNRISWPDLTGITATYIGDNFTSYVGVDLGGNLQQFVGPIDVEDKRDTLILGVLVHTGPTNLDSVGEFSTPGYDLGNVTGDLANAIGYINIEGNIYSADSNNLQLAKTSGSSFVLGGNFQTSRKAPNVIANSALSAPFLFKPYQDGSGGFTIDFPLTQDVDPDNYDDGSGTLASVPNNAQWQVQRIYSGTTNDDVIVAYGQNTYNKKNDALANIHLEEYNKNPVLRDTLLRGFLVIKKGTTDLSSTDDVAFIAADKFGQVPAQGSQLVIPNGIATVTSISKVADFTINMNKAYRVDTTSGVVTGTLAEATTERVGQVCECWVISNPFVNNFRIEGPNEDSIINGVTPGVGQVARAVLSSVLSNYKKISITIIAENEYLIDGIDSVSAV